MLRLSGGDAPGGKRGAACDHHNHGGTDCYHDDCDDRRHHDYDYDYDCHEYEDYDDESYGDY